MHAYACTHVCVHVLYACMHACMHKSRTRGPEAEALHERLTHPPQWHCCVARRRLVTADLLVHALPVAARKRERKQLACQQRTRRANAGSDGDVSPGLLRKLLCERRPQARLLLLSPALLVHQASQSPPGPAPPCGAHEFAVCASRTHGSFSARGFAFRGRRWGVGPARIVSARRRQCGGGDAQRPRRRARQWQDTSLVTRRT